MILVKPVSVTTETVFEKVGFRELTFSFALKYGKYSYLGFKIPLE